MTDTDKAVQMMRDACAFSRELAASAEVNAIAVLLMRADWLLEGKGEPPNPVPPLTIQWYRMQAERAIRRCDKSLQAVAERFAGFLAIKQWDATVDLVNRAEDDDAKERIIAAFVERITDTYEHHAQHKPGRSTAEVLQFRSEGIELPPRGKDLDRWLADSDVQP